MRRLILLLFFGCSLTNIYAQSTGKKSGKRPSWLNAAEKDFIICSGNGSSIELALAKSMNCVREEIANSIAVKVKSRSQQTTAETTINKSFRDFVEHYTNDLEITNASTDALSGISKSQIADYYWERKRSNRTIEYNYFIKYPFSETTLARLILEYENAEREKNETLKHELESIARISSYNEGLRIINNLKGMLGTFGDQREKQASAGISQTESILNSTSIDLKASALGHLYLLPTINGHHCTDIPDLSITSALDDFRFEKTDSSLYASYNVGSLNINGLGVFEVQYTLLGKKQEKKITIDFSSYLPSLELMKVIIDFSDPSSNKVENTHFDVKLSSKNQIPFIIASLQFDFGYIGNVDCEAISVQDSYKTQQEISGQIAPNQSVKSFIKGQSQVLGNILFSYTTEGDKTERKGTLYNQKFLIKQ